MASTAILRRYPVTRTEDPAELIDALCRTFRSDIRAGGLLPAHSPAEVRGIVTDQFTVGFVDSRICVDIAGGGSESSYFVNVVISGDLLSAKGEERIVGGPDLIGVFNPGDVHHLAPALSGTRTVGIRLHRDLVERELANLLGAAPDGPVRFDFALDLAHRRSDGLRLVLDTMLDQLGAGHSLSDHPAMRLGQLRTFATALLLTHRHSYSEALRTGQSPPRPRSVRRALEFIEDNLAEPITLGDIAAATGYSARTLTGAFGEHLGTSPMRHLRERRLDAARRHLTQTSDSVSATAARFGFGHLGRFSAAYQRRFGEPPSRTARRR
ncbi:AraC family transcriptional regulator [Pseudonocardia acaciae]|uniref:AraC family transcriptional regulator n=1 Tax=Pseudonocardia acaciae TaxID=551276 RepID=UPI000491B234|nr:AraC family transcriptional regulator [Pseudonocardia acaciae]